MKARGNVEDWLGKVEESMMSSLKKLTKVSIAEYDMKPREEWVTQHASQVNILSTVLFTYFLIVNLIPFL